MGSKAGGFDWFAISSLAITTLVFLLVANFVFHPVYHNHSDVKITPKNPIANRPVVFECVGHYIEHCKWNFEGKTGDEPGGAWERNGTSLHYTYSTAGVYAVTLAVEYQTGGTNRVTKRIRVSETTSGTAPSTPVSTPTQGEDGEGIIDILRRVDPVVAIVASLLSILASLTIIEVRRSR